MCNKADQKDGIFPKDGKGIYVGESSRSMYERAKEHEADRQALSEDSHQVKHWLTEHQELLAPPKIPFQDHPDLPGSSLQAASRSGQD